MQDVLWALEKLPRKSFPEEPYKYDVTKLDKKYSDR